MTEVLRISAAVEGYTDEAVVKRLVEHVGGSLGAVYGKRGKPDLRRRATGYANAAKYHPWIILVDLDDEFDCAPDLSRDWQIQPINLLCFRVAVRSVESWLLADYERLAQYLNVRRNLFPTDPEAVEHPKSCLVNLARRSRRRAIRDDMVPRPGTQQSTGPAYPSRVVEFVANQWRPDVAADRSSSLRRALDCIEGLIDRTRS